MATKGGPAAKGGPKTEKTVRVAKSAIDLQRMKLEKLMEHPEKPIILPEPLKTKLLAAPPEFNRNVMGSSAGAGSGEFHVYRHIRRREYARQKTIGEHADKERKETEFQQKLEENQRKAEEKTAKKRAKRQKKKLNAKKKKEAAKDSKDATGTTSTTTNEDEIKISEEEDSSEDDES